MFEHGWHPIVRRTQTFGAFGIAHAYLAMEEGVNSRQYIAACGYEMAEDEVVGSMRLVFPEPCPRCAELVVAEL